MARRLTASALLAVLLGVAACTSSSNPKVALGLDTRKITVESVDVTITPTRLDSSGAEFMIVFDTHSGSLDLDVANRSALAVNSINWTSPVWSGDGPGGHHRSGSLRFSAAGPVSGTAELTIAGLSAPLTTSWQLAGA